MTFLRHIAAAFRYLRYVPYVEAADHEDFWTPEDSAAYSHFANSPTGQKLRYRARNLINRSAVSATNASANIKHRCGWANGIAATFAWLDSHLFSPSSAHDETEPSGVGAPDVFEHLRP